MLIAKGVNKAIYKHRDNLLLCEAEEDDTTGYRIIETSESRSVWKCPNKATCIQDALERKGRYPDEVGYEICKVTHGVICKYIDEDAFDTAINHPQSMGIYPETEEGRDTYRLLEIGGKKMGWID